MSTQPTRTWTIVALAVILLASSLPFAVVHASDETKAGDGYVVQILPRNLAVNGQVATMTPVSNMYVFDVNVFDATGAPVPVKGWGFVMGSLDSILGGSTGHCAGSSSAQCLWADGGSSSTPTSTFTVRVPAGAVNFMGNLPGNGVDFYVVLLTGANGQSMASSNGTAPTGHFSLAANAFIAQGDYKDADQADGAATPLLLLDGQPVGLIQANNPLLNPGFELGYTDGSEYVTRANGSVQSSPAGNTAPGLAYPPGVKVAFASWYLRNYLVDTGPGITPASTHHYSTSNGTSGGYMSLLFNEADNGQHLALVQDVSAPNGLQWTGNSVGAPIQACFDARAWDAAGKVATFDVTVNIFKSAFTAGGSNPSVQTANQDIASVPTDYTWHNYCLSYAASDLAGQAIREFFLNFYYGTNHGAMGGVGAQVHFQLDNVQLSGFDLLAAQGSSVSAKNTLDDGYSIFIAPYQMNADETQGLVQDLTHIAGGKTAYVYDLSSTDFTGGYAKSVGLAGLAKSFQLLDARQVSPDRTTSSANVFNTTTAFFPIAGSDHVLVVVSPSAIGDVTPSTLPSGVTAWTYVQQATGSTYASTFGSNTTPSSSYYSPARNALAPFSLADAMDLDATPFALSASVSSQSLASPATITLSCPAASSGSTCAASTNNNPTLTATFSTPSKLLESVHLRLVSASNPGLSACASSVARCDAVVSTQGGTASFTLLKADLDNLKAKTGTYGVEVVSTTGTFVESATSNALGLDNALPYAVFSTSPATGITRVTRVSFVDASHDNDGYIKTRSWSLTQPDGSLVTFGSVGNNATSVAYTPPMLGAYTMQLTVMDNGGGIVSNQSSFTVLNVPPKAVLKVPAYSNVATAVFDASASYDPDGALPANAYAFSTDGVTFTPSTSGALYTVTPTADGAQTVFVQVTDADGATSVANATTVTDTQAPTSALSLGNYTDGTWSSTAVPYTVTRSDNTSGVAKTIVLVDGVAATFGPTGPVSGSITGDGRHNITVFSVDKAGNVEVAQPARRVLIDTTPPSVAFTNPQFAGPFGGVFSAGQGIAMTVAATDKNAPVTEVDFFVNNQKVGSDTDASDGFAYTYDTTGYAPGVYALQATAINAAGGSGSTAPLYVLIVPSLV